VDDGKITIVTTTGIVGDCVREIVGDKAEVISLMGAGVDPHLYKASQGDIAKLSSADIIIYNGLHLEGKMAQMLENYGKQKQAFAIGNYISKSDLKRVDSNSDLVDPHVWFNPKLWMQGLGGVAKELDKIDGLSGTLVNFEAYRKRVEALELELNEGLDSTLVEQGQRILITSHDAFEYFGDAFHFKVRGLQGISTAAEYGAKDVKDLIDFIIENKIKSVFIETSVSDKNLKAVIEGAKARGYNLKIGGTLYSDALGEANTNAGSYIGMLQANINTIIEGLK
jgi:manganese/zinc/iron transport system substrate-binding protein